MLQQITKENFGQMLGQFSTSELEGLTEKFPYFQQAHLLLAKKYQEEKDHRFDQQLQLAALYTADRVLLHEIFSEPESVSVLNTEVVEEENISPTTEVVIEESEPSTYIETTQVEAEREVEVVTNETAPTVETIAEEIIMNEIALAEEQLETETSNSEESKTSNDKRQTANTEPQTQVPHSFDEWLKVFGQIKDQQTASASKSDEQKDKELDRLIMENTPVLHLEEEQQGEETHYSRSLERFIEQQIEKHKHPEPVAPIDENEIAPELITETMAKVYEMQKKYARAIRAYELLSLKIPEKSALFAARINYIKNIA